MDDIKKIAVICGGSSPEREISLQSGSGVASALIELGYQTSIIDFQDLNDLGILKSYDLVFIALHGFEGEGGDLQESLDSLGIKYTGSNNVGCKNTWNKVKCKNILFQNECSLYESVLSI